MMAGIKFMQQAVPIRYNNPERLEEELNRVLGVGNWDNIGIVMDQYTIDVARPLTEDEIAEINENIRLHYKTWK